MYMTVGMVSVSNGYKPMKKKWNFELMEIYTNMKKTYTYVKDTNTWKYMWRVWTHGNAYEKYEHVEMLRERYKNMEKYKKSTNTWKWHVTVQTRKCTCESTNMEMYVKVKSRWKWAVDDGKSACKWMWKEKHMVMHMKDSTHKCTKKTKTHANVKWKVQTHGNGTRKVPTHGNGR